MLPELRQRCLQHVAICEEKGQPVALVQVRRSAEQQMAAFCQGRKFDAGTGVWRVTDRAAVVTNALPEKAPHCPHVDEQGNIGAAAYDIAPLVNGKPVWLVDGLDGRKITHPAFLEVIGPAGERVGLVWGHRFHSIDDMDHFELPGWRAMRIATEADGDWT